MPLQSEICHRNELTLCVCVCSVPATSITPKLSSSLPSDINETVVVPENAANAVFKFADESLRLTVDAGPSTNISLFCAIVV